MSTDILKFMLMDVQYTTEWSKVFVNLNVNVFNGFRWESLQVKQSIARETQQDDLPRSQNYG